jgi:hypothetical protein
LDELDARSEADVVFVLIGELLKEISCKLTCYLIGREDFGDDKGFMLCSLLKKQSELVS